MTSEILTPQERADCAVCAGFLPTHRVWAAVALGAVALVAVAQTREAAPAAGMPGWVQGMLWLAGVLVERYLALRLGFDACLFNRLAGDADFGTHQLDGALARVLGVDKAPGRSVAQRIAGARSLYKRHAAVSIVLSAAAVIILFGGR